MASDAPEFLSAVARYPQCFQLDASSTKEVRPHRARPAEHARQSLTRVPFNEAKRDA